MSAIENRPSALVPGGVSQGSRNELPQKADKEELAPTHSFPLPKRFPGARRTGGGAGQLVSGSTAGLRPGSGIGVAGRNPLCSNEERNPIRLWSAACRSL